MKKKYAFIIISIMMLFLFGCSKGETLLENAAPKQSALTVIKYDGEHTRAFWEFDEANTKNILKDINSSKKSAAADWNLDKVVPPIYGFSIMAKDETFLELAWSNGYWIKSDGTVLKSELNVQELEEKYQWNWTEEFDSINVMPCMQYLCKDENGWNVEHMTPVINPEVEDGVELTVVEQTDKSITVSIYNNSENYWCYGEYFSIEVCEDGNWYKVPTIPGEWAFHDIAYEMEPQKVQEETYNLEMYGTLSPGKYRIEIEKHYVEFEVK